MLDDRLNHFSGCHGLNLELVFSAAFALLMVQMTATAASKTITIKTFAPISELALLLDGLVAHRDIHRCRFFRRLRFGVFGRFGLNGLEQDR